MFGAANSEDGAAKKPTAQYDDDDSEEEVVKAKKPKVFEGCGQAGRRRGVVMARETSSMHRSRNGKELERRGLR